MSSAWVISVGPKSNDNVLIGDKSEETQRGEGHVTTEAETGQEREEPRRDSPVDILRGHCPSDTLVSDF